MKPGRSLWSLLIFSLLSICTNAAPSAGVHVSFVQVAPSGSLNAVPGQSNQYTLTLSNISPYITYYLDRPNRTTGLAPVKNFVAAWSVGSNSFATDNPNAVIYAGKMNGEFNTTTAYVVQLSSPVYNAANNQITYTVTPLGSEGILLNSIDLNAISLTIN